MKALGEVAWITSDGFIWRQIFDRDTAEILYGNNLFEVYKVDITDETESLITSYEEISEIFDKDDSNYILAIEVGSLEPVYNNLFKIK